MLVHEPVLLEECLRILHPSDGETVLDVTTGLGGHARRLCQSIGSSGSFVGLDADQENLVLARTALEGVSPSVSLIHSNFRSLPECLPPDRRLFDVIIADLGLSSAHIDDPARGFSFRFDAPLDLRFDRFRGMTAAMSLSSLDPPTLLSAFREFGELPRAHMLVDAIVRYRKDRPILGTQQLVEIVQSVYGYKSPSVLPQVFQALRMFVNDELGALRHLLSVAPNLLSPGGRFGIISFHSLEDRLVKQSFRALSTGVKDPVTGAVKDGSAFERLCPGGISPGDEEVRRNPRARSARLRALCRRQLYTSSRS